LPFTRRNRTNIIIIIIIILGFALLFKIKTSERRITIRSNRLDTITTGQEGEEENDNAKKDKTRE
jgi:hypothetical protein